MPSLTASKRRQGEGLGIAPLSPPDRAALEQLWLHLTRSVLPSIAAERGFPVRDDHCFQRILLDAACDGRWTDHVDGRPAYRRIDDARLARAVALAEAVIAGEKDLHILNRRSLKWRRVAKARSI